jgi:hypothetical protein
MKQNEKNAILSLLGGIGVILLLLGIFSKVYDFGTGLILAMIVWVITGAISAYLNVKKK